MTEMIILLVELTIIVCVFFSIPLIHHRHSFNRVLSLVNGIAFVGWGVVFFIASYLTSQQNYLIIFCIASEFGIISIAFKVSMLDDFQRLTNVQKIRLIVIPLGICTFVLSTLLFYQTSIYRATIPSGMVEGGVFLDVYFKIINTPLITFSIFLSAIVGLVHFVTKDKAAKILASVGTFTVPFFIFILILIGIIPLPDDFAGVFGGNIAFIFLYMIVMFLTVGVMWIFQRIQDLQY